MKAKHYKQTLLAALILAGSATAQAQNCEYSIGYIADEAKRPYAVNKVYRYTPERIEQILRLRDEGAKLCQTDQKVNGLRVLKEAVKLINFTRLR